MRITALGALLGALLATAGCGTSSETTINGSLTVKDACQTTGGYSDIRPRTAVTVSDAAGDLIGTGRLGDGVFQEPPGLVGCRFPFVIENAPIRGGDDLFAIEVGDRGEMLYTGDEITAEGFTADFVLGFD